MRCVDVNVLVYAFRTDIEQHDEYRQRLEGLANGEEPLGIPDLVFSGFVRLVTNRRVFVEPSSSDDAWAFVEQLLDSPAVATLQPGEHHWEHFRRLAAEIGNDVPDAYLAAYATERNATWLSADRGFARFPSLRWQHPLTL